MNIPYNNCLYLTFQGISEGDGVSKKVFSQKDALIELGINTNIIYPKVDHNQLIYYKDGVHFHTINYQYYKQGQKELFNKIYDYITISNIQILYIRYCVNANNSTFINFLRNCKKKNNCKILLEIPTYPYDKEVRFNSLKQSLRIFRERFYRNKLKSCIDKIVTFSTDKIIFGVPTINISNAVDARNLSINALSPINKQINLIAVANIAYWHGFDRIIKGLHNYYNNQYNYQVNLTIVGNGDSNLINELKELVKRLGLARYITFTGGKDGKELDKLYLNQHIAIGCLGCHRKGIYEVKSLKNVEYAMRGLPFIYSENNNDFDDKNYVLKVPADDSPINIMDLCKFILDNNFNPNDIRKSVLHLTWDNQMAKILSSI